jgi:hypothetical protein
VLSKRDLTVWIVAAVALAVAIAGCGGDASPGTTTSTHAASPKPEPQPKPRLKPRADVASICSRISGEAAPLVRQVAPRARVHLEPSRLGPLKQDVVRSYGFSGCELHAADVNIHLTLDSASEVHRRYDNRITESEQFSSQNSRLFPYPVPRVGDRMVAGGGANWLPTFNQLVSVRSDEMLALDFYVRGVSTDLKKQAAAELARSTWSLLGIPRS